jgi:hypothetical protein
MTFKARWQPFQDLGEDDARRAQDEMDLMHNMLRARRRDGSRQPVGYDGRRVSLGARPRRLRA